MSAVSGLDAVLARRIENRNQSHDAAIAAGPAPGETGKGYALAGDGIDLPANILEAADPGGQNRAMAGLPFRKILQHVVAGALLVVLTDEGQQTVGPTGPVRPDGGTQRMVERLGVGAYHFDLLGCKPLAGLFVEPRRVAVVLLIVAVVLVPPGIDDDDVAGLYLGARLFQI